MKSKAIKGRGEREKTNREKRAKVPHLEPIRQKRALQAKVKRVGPGALLSGDLFGELDVSDLLFELFLRCLLRLATHVRRMPLAGGVRLRRGCWMYELDGCSQLSAGFALCTGPMLP